MLDRVRLAGIAIRDQDVFEVARPSAKPSLSTWPGTRDRLSPGNADDALTMTVRESIVRSLDASDSLTELSGVLLREHGWRRDQGLA